MSRSAKQKKEGRERRLKEREQMLAALSTEERCYRRMFGTEDDRKKRVLKELKKENKHRVLKVAEIKAEMKARREANGELPQHLFRQTLTKSLKELGEQRHKNNDA